MFSLCSVFVDSRWPLLTKVVQNQHLLLERSLLERAVMYLYFILYFFDLFVIGLSTGIEINYKK